MSFREASGRQPQRIGTSIEEGFSNFLHIDQTYRSHPVLRRIFSLARKLDFKSLLVEEIHEDDCALLAEENAALALRDPKYRHSIIHRISFFTCAKDEQPEQSHFRGYVVFKNDFFDGGKNGAGHVYECVIPPFRRKAENNFIHCERDYGVSTALGKFAVRGVLYAQQNDLTFVCAHVSLRSALAWVLPAADITYGEINRIAGVDHKTIKLGSSASGGLETSAIEAVLKQLKLNYSILPHEPGKNVLLQNEFQRDLYGFIESGCPALLGFELSDPNPPPAGQSRHLIPVIGHTFNEDAWVPEAQRIYFGKDAGYFPSEHWLSSHVIHDDNVGPYFCIPRHYLKQDNIRVIIGLKPSDTPFNAVEAETAGFAYLNFIARSIPRLGTDWYDRFAVFCENGLLILRTMLVGKAGYLDHLRKLESWGKAKRKLEPALLDEFTQRLPDNFWLVEASAPELFSASRRKFGEVLISATTPMPKPLDASLLLAARLPGLALFHQGVNFIPQPTQLDGHTDILCACR